MQDQYTIPMVAVDSAQVSVFSTVRFEKTARGGMLLSDQINVINFRMRESAPGYSSDWHVAGDPTYIIIQQGVLRIILRDGDSRDFSAGDCFIANDFLNEGLLFDASLHGHRAEVVGSKILKASHFKLAERPK